MQVSLWNPFTLSLAHISWSVIIATAYILQNKNGGRNKQKNITFLLSLPLHLCIVVVCQASVVLYDLGCPCATVCVWYLSSACLPLPRVEYTSRMLLLQRRLFYMYSVHYTLNVIARVVNVTLLISHKALFLLILLLFLWCFVFTVQAWLPSSTSPPSSLL